MTPRERFEEFFHPIINVAKSNGHDLDLRDLELMRRHGSSTVCLFCKECRENITVYYVGDNKPLHAYGKLKDPAPCKPDYAGLVAETVFESLGEHVHDNFTLEGVVKTGDTHRQVVHIGKKGVVIVTVELGGVVK